MARRQRVLGWEARLLVILTAVLVVFGLASVYAASSALVERGRAVGATRVLDQLIGAAAGGLLLLLAARVNLDRVRQLAWPMVLLTGALLVVLVLPFSYAIAPRINGARRWLNVGVSIQVSEIAKLAVVVWTAMLCAKKGTEVRRMRRGLLPVLTVVAPLAALILLQPDLSTAVVIGFLALLILFASGARIGHFILLGMAALPLLWRQIEGAQYRVLRMTTFLDPGADRLRDAYQIDQSLIGIGAGQLFGVGFGQGQQKLGFLPYPYTDFIFSTIGEEWGFLGVLFLMMLFSAYVLVALRLAAAAGDPFRQYLGVGLAAMIGVDAFLHMGVGLAIVPTTGLVLPFVSYGRSGLAIALIATGFLVNLGTRRRPVTA
ncbi:MAG: FtsW/RodA/SpoVE family cell cycle protein [Gemmatimonadetes bacterium]|nr:FtsW/RodA/SpoVE family cell cycle protein [Gemmatimonadota bacterium]